MRGMPYTPAEALEAVARTHARLIDRGADHESAVRLVAHQYALRLDVARWAVSKRRHLRDARLEASAPPRRPGVSRASGDATARREPAFRAELSQ